jgi:riboflavin kinase/FMN adenylyltransferase
VKSDAIEVYADYNFNPDRSGSAITTVGTYDGVHSGHQEILQRMMEGGNDRVRTVVSFEPHPQTITINRPGVMPTLSNTPEKIRLLRNYGMDRVYILYFTDALAKVRAEDFLKDILLDKLNSSKLVVGYNHAFGNKREGNSDFLRQIQSKYGYDLEVVGPHYVGEEAVSSTKIRKALGVGDVDKANQFLGRPYFLSGSVVPGRGVGRELTFPTANLELVHPEKLIPKVGVYTVAVGFGDQVYPGMLNIGTRPTFGEGDVTIEVHLINFAGELYGKVLGMLFLARLRDEEHFESAEALIAQIKIDREESLRIFSVWPTQRLKEEFTRNLE